MAPVQAILRQLCPRCRAGRIYRRPLLRGGWLDMNERCPVCHLKFEREQGYFLGAMYIGYALSVAPALLLVMLLWQGAHWPYDRAWLCAILVYLPFAPLVARISRVLWIYVDQTIDPERG